MIDDAQYRHAISVEADQRGWPVAFTWRGRRYHVEAVVGTWHLMDRWWERKPPRSAEALKVRARTNRYYFRVQCPGLAFYELYHDVVAVVWVLDRVLD